MHQFKKLLRRQSKLSEERSKGKNRGSLRSRSVDPYLGRRPPTTTFMTQSYPPAKHPPIAEVIPKTTEYRSQFAWPPYSVESTPRRDKKTPVKSSTPRKSVSMGAIQAVQEPPVKSVKLPPGGEAIEDEVTVKSPTNEEILRTLEEQIIETKDDLAADIDTNIALEEASSRPKKFKTEYKARFKAPSKYVCVDGSWMRNKEYQPLEAAAGVKAAEDIPISWYGEVLELRKKAGEYKLRSWGTTITSDNPDQIFSRQKKVWEEVSQRSSLSALALAATPSPRSTKPEPDSARGRIPTRHHLERTTPSASLSTTARSKSAVSSRGKDVADGDGLPKMHTAGRSKAKAAPGSAPAPSAAPPVKEAKIKKAEKLPEKEMVFVNGEDIFSSKEDLPSPQEQSTKEKIAEYIPVIKSPPEPTRVKSPEQIIVNSPEPVKWTVPLDTGIKWTGTLQVDGDGTPKPKKDDDLDKSLKEVDCLGKNCKEESYPEVIQKSLLPTDSGMAIYSNGADSLSEED